MTASGSFLQSAEWEDFERSLGRGTCRVGGTLLLRRALPLGLHYWYCPRPGALRPDFFAGARHMAADDHSVFMKIDPTEEIGSAGGARPARAIQPRETIILDLEDRPETELMAAMHEKTRYNIRLAARRGVSVVLRPAPVSAQDGEVFWRLMQETTRRDGFRPHPREYYEKMLAARSARFANELVFAEYKGDVVAAAIVNFYRPVAGTPYATYLHGASGREHRDVMAPHLLQWAAIREALRRGCATYDFWGIDARRWPGVTRFKRGFGGREVSCPPSTDIVYRPPWYGLYALAKKGKI